MYIYIYNVANFVGNHLPNTACLTRVFFKSGAYCSRL